MANPFDRPFDDRPDLIEELTRFGLIGPPPGGYGPQGGRPRSNAPEMPVPQIDRGSGGPLPMIPMTPPAVGNPLQMLMGGGGGPTPFGNYLQSQGTKLWGGFDPQSGIRWNTGRRGQTGSALAK